MSNTPTGRGASSNVIRRGFHFNRSNPTQEIRTLPLITQTTSDTNVPPIGSNTNTIQQNHPVPLNYNIIR